MPQGLQVMDGQGRIIVDTNRFVLREVAAIFADAGNSAVQVASIPTPDAVNIVVSNNQRLDAPLVDAEYTGGQVRYRFYADGGGNSRLSVLAY